jgi:hypothetical protein
MERGEENVDWSVYQEAAFVCTIFICDDCARILDTDDLSPSYPNDGWINALADEALRGGWIVKDSDARVFEFKCPDCAAIKGTR